MINIIDLHTHTISSGHAYSTLEENVEGAIRNKIKVLGLSDHAPGMQGGPNIFHFLNMRIIPDIIKGIRVLKGIEVNIMDYTGKLDVCDNDLKKMDYAIASLHPPCIKSSSVEDNTNALIGAIKNPYINIIGHPDDSRFPIDYEKVVAAAKENNVLLEVNNSSLHPANTRVGAKENIVELLNLCKKNKTSIVLGSDSHISYDIGNFERALKIIKEYNFPDELIVNTSIEKLNKFIST